MGEQAALTTRFEVREHPQYLEVACAGTYAPEVPVGIAEYTLTLATRAGRTAALIDIRQIAGRAPTMSERYDQAVQVASLQARTNPRIRLAVLGHEPMVHPQRFGEIVATNRGAQLRVFTDETAALDWLLSRPKQH